jgi:hypothetical protein
VGGEEVGVLRADTQPAGERVGTEQLGDHGVHVGAEIEACVDAAVPHQPQRQRRGGLPAYADAGAAYGAEVDVDCRGQRGLGRVGKKAPSRRTPPVVSARNESPAPTLSESVMRTARLAAMTRCWVRLSKSTKRG